MTKNEKPSKNSPKLTWKQFENVGRKAIENKLIK